MSGDGHGKAAAPIALAAIVRRRGFERAGPIGRIALAAVVVAAALAGTPARALAAEPLSITTPFPAISVAPGSKASLDLTVTADAERRVDLAVSGVPDGWSASLRGGGLAVDAVLVDATTPQTVRLDVQVAPDAAAGTTRLTVEATSGSLRSTLPIDLTVSTAAGGDVTLTTDFPSLKGSSTTDFRFNLTLRNGTAQDLTFSLNAQGPVGWTVTAQPASQSQASSFQVNAGDTASVTVEAKAPADAAAATYPIDVTATSSAGTVGGQLQVEVTGQYSMDLTTPEGRLNAEGQAGSVIARTLSIVNTGTAPLTDVSISETLPSGWTVTYDPAGPIASVDAGASVTVTANMVPRSDAIAGDYVATFRANAAGESVNASTDIRVTVETSLNWLIVGGGIIVLALLGLFWVFQRYGRR